MLRLLERLGYELFTADLLRKSTNGELLVVEGLEEFREHLGGRLAITLLREIGIGFEVHEMEVAWIRVAIVELNARHQARLAGHLIQQS